MDLFLQNLNFLKANAPNIYEKISTEEPYIKDVNLHMTQNEILVCHETVRCGLQTKYEKNKEAEWTFCDLSVDTEVLILFGFSFFEMVPFITNKFKKLRKIVFIEPTLQIFIYFLQTYDFVAVFKNIRKIQLVFTLNFSEKLAAEDTMAMIGSTDKFSIQALAPYQNLFPDYYENFKREMKSLLGLKSIQFGNSQSNSRLVWIREIMRNVSVRAYPAELLEPIIKGRPVVLVGAGPSLEKNMHLLEAAAKRAIIIAAGKAVQVLNRAGIRPHFNAGLDATNCDYYDDLQYPDVPLLFGNQFSHEILCRYPGPKFNFLLNTDPINLYLYKKAQDRCFSVSTGTSVINSVHDFVARLGCSCVIFTGQDMCFYDDKLYAQGDQTQSQRWTESMYADRDIYGNEVRTIHVYSSIKYCIEAIAAKYPHVGLANATEGGLGISGAPNYMLEDVLQGRPSLDIDIRQVIKDLIVNRGESQISTQDCLLKVDFFQEIEAVNARINQLFEALRELDFMLGHKVKSTRLEEKIRQIQRKGKKLQSISVYEMVLRPYVEDIFAVIETRYALIESASIRERADMLLKQMTGKMAEIHKYCLLIVNEYEKREKGIKDEHF